MSKKINVDVSLNSQEEKELIIEDTDSDTKRKKTPMEVSGK